jgi:hypothetical protein
MIPPPVFYRRLHPWENGRMLIDVHEWPDGCSTWGRFY